MSSKLAMCGDAHSEVAWNESRQKYLRQGCFRDWSMQRLIDMSSKLTMVAADEVDPNGINYHAIEPVICVHGDTVPYPTTIVTLNMG